MNRTSILVAVCLACPLATQAPPKTTPAWVEKVTTGAEPLPAHLPAPRAPEDKVSAMAGRSIAAVLDDPDLLLFDQPQAGGAWWVRGHDFKACFDERCWTFIGKPRASAPDLAPVAFKLSRVAVGGRALAIDEPAPRRDGRRLTYAHGPVVQHLDVDSKGIEQSFVFHDLPLRGELVVEVEVTTPLTGRTGPSGIEFTGPWDHVTCSPAVAFDANGARIDCATALVDGRIVIRVPQGFVEQAALPLTIDPRVASAVPFASTSGDLADPDVACMPTFVFGPTPSYADVWSVVWSHYFGGNDWDCYVQQLDANLGAGSFFVIDYTTNGWQRPRIASIGQVGLVVAQVRSTGNPSRVSGRTLAASSGQLDIGVAAVDSLRPDVGGDASSTTAIVLRGSAWFTVVWEHAYSATDHDIYARQVRHDGTLAPGLIYVETNTLNQSNPSICKSCGGWDTVFTSIPSSQRYGIVWQQRVSASDEDIYGAMLTWDGQFVTVGGNNTFPIDTSTHRDTWPQVSTPTLKDAAGRRRMLAVYERTSSGAGDIAATCFDHQGVILASANVNALENDPVRLAWPQYRPSVDSDGVRFGVAYHEVYQGNLTANDLDTRMSLVALTGNGLIVQEAGAILSFSGNREINVQVASRYSADGAPTLRYCTANDRDNTDNTFAIDARTFDGVPVDTFVTRATGCGSAVISASGHTRLAQTLQFTVTTNPYLTGFVIGVGAPTSTPVPGCPGCTAGTSGLSLFGSSYNLAIPYQLGLIGLPVSVQGFVFGSPGSPCLGQLMLTDTIDFTVQ